jgi:exodeoxyribonuclease VII small subunit
MSETTEKRVQISISEQIELEQADQTKQTEQDKQTKKVKGTGQPKKAEETESFEQAVTELEEIVNKLEKGELTLDESIQYFQRGVELTKYCSKKLDEAERSITMLIEGEDGIIEKEMTV